MKRNPRFYAPYAPQGSIDVSEAHVMGYNGIHTTGNGYGDTLLGAWGDFKQFVIVQAEYEDSYAAQG